MKRTLPLLYFALLASISTSAQWTNDVSVNTTVRAVTSGEAVVPLTTAGPDGSTYVSWFDNESGEYQLRMQRLDADGYRLWPDTGLVVSAYPQNSAVFRYDLQGDANGNAIVAFQDERTGSLDIVAYKIGPDGSFLWGPDGVELPTPGTTGLSPVVAALVNGNSAVAWSTNDSPGRLAIQLLGPTGSLLLATPIEIAANTAVGRPKLIASDDGGFIVQYVVSNGGFGLPPGTMYAMRYDAAGNTVWTNAVQVSSKTIPFFFFPEPVPDGHGGFYVAFNTGNPDLPAYTDVFTQRVRANGTLWSTDGTRLDSSALIQKFSVGKGVALVDDDDGLMVPIMITDGAQGQRGVAVQGLDTAGNRLLGNLAVTVVPMGSTPVEPWDISATDDGAVIAHVSGVFGQVHIAATRVGLDGTTLWTPAQRDISTVNSNKDDVQLTAMDDGQVVVFWQDDRNPSGIYAQNIDSLDISTGIAHLPEQGSFFRLEQNPSASPVLLMTADLHGDMDIHVLDAQGRTVYASRGPVSNRVKLPVTNLANGLYTIRVSGIGEAMAVHWMKQ